MKKFRKYIAVFAVTALLLVTFAPAVFAAEAQDTEQSAPQPAAAESADPSETETAPDPDTETGTDADAEQTAEPETTPDPDTAGETAALIPTSLKGFIGDASALSAAPTAGPVVVTGSADDHITLGIRIYAEGNENPLSVPGAKVTWHCDAVEPAGNSTAVLRASDTTSPADPADTYTKDSQNDVNRACLVIANHEVYDENDLATYKISCTYEMPADSQYAAPDSLIYTIQISDKGDVEIAPEQAVIVIGDPLTMTGTITGTDAHHVYFSTDSDALELTTTGDTAATVTGTAPVEDAQVTARLNQLNDLTEKSAAASITVTALDTPTETTVEAGQVCPALTPTWVNGEPTYYKDAPVSTDQIGYTWTLNPGDQTAEAAISAANTAHTATLADLSFAQAGTYEVICTPVINGEELGTSVTFPITVTAAEPAPTAEPTPTEAPTAEPTPTEALTAEPTPTEAPTAEPTPTEAPTAEPTPTEAPTAEPTPTEAPTAEPTPTEAPTAEPTPTEAPTAEPTPTEAPTAEPTPTEAPSHLPVQTAEPAATPLPMMKPTAVPTVMAPIIPATTVPEPVITPVPTIAAQPTASPVPELLLKENAPKTVSMPADTDQEVVVDTPSDETEVQDAGNWFRDFDGTHVAFLDLQHQAVNPDASLATGMTAVLMRNADGAVLDEAPVVVRGDVLGTGEINIVQLVAMARDLNGTAPLSGLYLQAGDLDGDGVITITDLVDEARLLGTTGEQASENPASQEDAIDPYVYAAAREDLPEALADAHLQTSADTRLQVADENGNAVEDTTPIATGMKAELLNTADKVLDTATVIVPGDVLGTGHVDIAQLVRLARDLNGTQSLTGIYAMAGDMNRNGEIEIADLADAAHLLTAK